MLILGFKQLLRFCLKFPKKYLEERSSKHSLILATDYISMYIHKNIKKKNYKKNLHITCNYSVLVRTLALY